MADQHCFLFFFSRSKQAQDLFKLADVDQSGKLSLAEIKRLLEASEFDVDDKELQKIFKRVDANSDGELDDKEFLDLVKYIIGNKWQIIWHSKYSILLWYLKWCFVLHFKEKWKRNCCSWSVQGFTKYNRK